MKTPVTRVEVQFRRNLPYRNFDEIGRYAELDLLPSLSFWRVGRKRDHLKPIQSLAAEGLLRNIDEFGVQAVSKRFAPQQWSYISKKLLRPASDSDFPDLNKLLQRSIRDWLEDRTRFPRFERRP